MRLVEPSPPWGNGSICSSDLSIWGRCQKSKQTDLWKWDWHLLEIAQLLSFICVLVVVLTLKCVFFFFCFAYSLFTGLHKNNYCNQFSFKCSDRVQMDKSIHIIWTSLLFLSLQWRRKLSRCCRCPCDLVHSACSWKRAYETMTISFRCTLEMGVEFVNVVLCSLMSFRINNNAFMGKEGSHLK